jgi:NADH-quinone oxidoreductase subunit E
MGGDVIFDALEEHLGVGHDETTEDGQVTLERVECNAACDYAPVVMVNWEFFDNQTPASARELVDRLRGGREVAPTRGANSVASFKEVSRVLAGFNDGRAGEGVGAGTPSQRGTVLAQQMGWTAPDPDESHITPPGRQAAAAAAADSQARAARSSGTDPAAPAGDADRAGAPAGKPPAETTAGEGDSGGGTAPNPTPQRGGNGGKAGGTTGGNDGKEA